ncbi:5912_t:CDS:2, partial [Gigaspora margarita]
QITKNNLRLLGLNEDKENDFLKELKKGSRESTPPPKTIKYLADYWTTPIISNRNNITEHKWTFVQRVVNGMYLVNSFIKQSYDTYNFSYSKNKRSSGIPVTGIGNCKTWKSAR